MERVVERRYSMNKIEKLVEQLAQYLYENWTGKPDGEWNSMDFARQDNYRQPVYCDILPLIGTDLALIEEGKAKCHVCAGGGVGYAGPCANCNGAGLVDRQLVIPLAEALE